MKIIFIRNATIILEYGGKRLLIDPMLAAKDSYAGLAGTMNSDKRFPCMDLPFPAADIIKNIDAIFLSHTHRDHWDNEAATLIAKNQKIFVQDDADKNLLISQGFNNVSVLGASLEYDNAISITKTQCQHGTKQAYDNEKIGQALGHVCGFIFEHAQEPTTYFVSDTIWIDAVEQNLIQYQPDVVILNAGDARMQDFGPIIMGKDDVLHAHQVLPEAHIVAIHMEAVNHAMLSRKALADFLEKEHIRQYVSIPLEGETLNF